MSCGTISSSLLHVLLESSKQGGMEKYLKKYDTTISQFHKNYKPGDSGCSRCIKSYNQALRKPTPRNNNYMAPNQLQI